MGRPLGSKNKVIKPKKRRIRSKSERERQAAQLQILKAKEVEADRKRQDAHAKFLATPEGHPGYNMPQFEVDLPDHVNDEPAHIRSHRDRQFFRATPSQRILVAGLAAFGVPREGIAAYIRVNEETLRRYFRFELEEARPRTEAALVAIMLVKALGGNTSAATMLLKCGFGWSETGKSVDGPATLEALTVDQRLRLIESIRTSVAPEKAGRSRSRKKQTDLVATAGTTNGSRQFEG